MNRHGPAPYWTSTATLYWRALRRTERRARRLRADPTERGALLLAEAARTTNRLFWLAYRPDLDRRHTA